MDLLLPIAGMPNDLLDISKGKGTVVLMPSHQAMEKHGGCEGNVPCILNLGNVWKWVVSFTGK